MQSYYLFIDVNSTLWSIIDHVAMITQVLRVALDSLSRCDPNFGGRGGGRNDDNTA